MIQRVQSLYLFLGSLALFAVFITDLARFVDQSGLYYYLSIFEFQGPAEVMQAKDNTIFILLLSLSAGVMLATMLLFKNRKLQRQICRVQYLLIAGGVVAMFIFISDNHDRLPELTERVGKGIAFYLPFVAFAFNFLASRAIKKDQDLIKSLDRLR
jgi:peptidoglycan/LPS O-acetylase OafA/YrhL